MKFRGEDIDREALLHIQKHFDGLKRTILNLDPDPSSTEDILCKENMLNFIVLSENTFLNCMKKLYVKKYNELANKKNDVVP